MVYLACPAHVGDVNHTVDAFFELYECAVGSQIANLAANMGADRIVVDSHFPGIFFELAESEGYFLFLLVDIENNSFDFVADFEDFRGLCDALCPGAR